MTDWVELCPMLKFAYITSRNSPIVNLSFNTNYRYQLNTPTSQPWTDIFPLVSKLIDIAQRQSTIIPERRMTRPEKQSTNKWTERELSYRNIQKVHWLCSIGRISEPDNPTRSLTIHCTNRLRSRWSYRKPPCTLTSLRSGK
jgi:hypothetical protein